MDDAFLAGPLAERQVDQAYALARTLVPDLSIERWRAFARARGVMTVGTGRGYLHGLFTWTVDEHLRHGRILSVENYVVLDLFDRPAAAAALLAAMDELARTEGCEAIHTSLPEAYTALPEACAEVLDHFRDAGHAVEALRLCKPIVSEEA